ncbi:MAG: branched-chain amino acid ABC transporter permease [Desulfurococcaceae archaeon]
MGWYALFEVLAVLSNVIAYASFYLVFSLPLTLSYRTTKVINFAHANFITYGAYVSIFLDRLLGLRSLALSLAAAFLVAGALALVSNVVAFAPLQRRGASQATIMIASMGLWIIYRYILYVACDVAGSAARTNFVSYGRIDFVDVPKISLGPLALDKPLLSALLTAALSVGLLASLLTLTKLGRAMRALADEPQLAEISGVPRNAITALTWFLCGGVAGMGGAAWPAFSGSTTPEIGDFVILQAFTVAFIGGLVSLPRTALGAFVISAVENVGIALLNSTLGLPVSYKPLLTFTTLIAVLVAFPPLGAAGGLPYRFRRGGRR